MWIESARWESNPRPAPYKDAALTTELRARGSSRAGGNRTHTWRIKSPLCCQLHHDPNDRSGVCVSIDARATLFSSSCLLLSVVATNPASLIGAPVELSTTWLSARYGQPVLDYQCSPVGMVGLEPTTSCFQGTQACRCPTSRQSVRTAGFEPRAPTQSVGRSWSGDQARYQTFLRPDCQQPVWESNPSKLGLKDR